jgi:adenylosuccinate lyase
MRNKYENPLCERYASKKMQEIFSPDKKFSTWRKLWVALAESQKELGLDISDRQIEAMKEHIYDINYEVAEQREKEVRHDVMAHIYAYGVQCPEARPIIHLGATSGYVGDNTDLILMKEALIRIKSSLTGVIVKLAAFALKYKGLPVLAYTHFQPAQPTTLGKRATLWLQDLVSDMDALLFVMSQIKMLGCRGATGTAASFLELFDGDAEKVSRLEKMIARKMGFDDIFDVSGQTYPRKLDYNVLSVLSGIAQSAWKFSNDIRLMSHLKEVDEPFEEKQVGSSAMAYKRKQREISMGRMMQAVPEADVVVTNPTTYAVALKYDDKKHAAPVVTAKGKGYVAKRIKEKAKEHGVEIVENKPLAQALYKSVDVGRQIPEEFYKAVAEILAWVYGIKGKYREV